MSQINNSNQSSDDLLRILLALEKKVMRDLKVSSLARVKQINSDGTALVEKIPLMTDETSILNEYYNNVSDLKVGDIVIVLYLDRNSIQVIQQLKNNQSLTSINEKSELHSNKCGIIISKLNINNEKDGE